MSVITGLAIASNNIANLLNTWDSMGVFDYVLPFLLIFAIVYGILSKIHIFGEVNNNKGVNAVISIAIGLLALQWDYVPQFFQVLFPYAGMGISILLVALIMMALFAGEDMFRGEKWYRNAFLGLGAIIALIVILEALGDFNFGNFAINNFWEEFGPSIITLVIIGALIGLVVGGGKVPKAPPAERPKE